MENYPRSYSGGFCQPISKTNSLNPLAQYHQQQRPLTYDVYVGKIPQDFTEEFLRGLLSQFGEIKSITIKESLEYKGDTKFGFVRFVNEIDANTCVETLSRDPHQNPYRLVANIAKRRENRDSPFNQDYNHGSWSKHRADNRHNMHRQSHNNRQTRNTEYGGGYNTLSNSIQQTTNNWGNGASRSHHRQAMFEQQNTTTNHSVNALPVTKIIREDVVLVTQIESPVSFWGQLGIPSVAQNLSQASEELQEYCPTGLKIKLPIQYNNKCYGAIYPFDGLWYRCVASALLPHGKVKVRYIDYGNVEEIDQTSMVELPPSLSEPKPFAHLYQLHNCTMSTDPSAVMVNTAALAQLDNLINGQLIKVKVVTDSTYGATNVIIDKPDAPGKTINDIMIASVCCQKTMRSDGGGGIIEKSVAEKPLNDVNSPNKSVKELRRARDIDNLKKTIKFQSETICNLNKLFEAVKSENSELNQVIDHALNKKVDRILATVVNVDETRDNCVLCKEQMRIVDSGVALVSDTTERLTLEHIDTFTKVCFSSAALNEVQDSIRDCDDKEGLVILIERRNEAKQQLLKNIDDFLNEISKLDMEMRENKLKVALQDLGNLHQPVVESNDISLPQALDKYTEWKANMLTQMSEARGITDGMSSQLAKEFGRLQKLLDPTDNFSVHDYDKDKVDLDLLSLQLDQAVDNEYQQVQIGQNDESAQIISVLVGLLKNEILQELSDIDHLRTSSSDYTRLREDMVRMTSSSPDVSRLLNVRKNLKAVKSKFRHKLADCKDLEEGDDHGNCEDLKKVETELNEYRSELHSLLTEEKEALSELATVVADHFPELSLQYPEFGITKFMQSNGLVKPSWELCYYSHGEITDVSSSPNNYTAFVTMFNGQQCSLKEYNLASINDLDAFEVRAVAYSKVDEPTLMKLKALFYDKTNRKAFIHVPFYDTNLESWLKTNPSNKMKHGILMDICKALESLQKQGIIHGSLLMKNVFVDSENKAIVGDFCFTQDVQERVTSTADYLLKKTVPVSCEASPIFDILCLRELAHIMFEVDVGSLQTQCQDSKVATLMKTMCPVNGGQQPTASELLKNPCFYNIDFFNNDVEPENITTEISNEGISSESTVVQQTDDTEKTSLELPNIENEDCINIELPEQSETIDQVVDGDQDTSQYGDDMVLLEQPQITMVDNDEVVDQTDVAQPVEDGSPKCDNESKTEDHVCGENIICTNGVATEMSEISVPVELQNNSSDVTPDE